MMSKSVTESQEKLAYSIADVARLTTLSKSHIRQEVKNHNLKIRRIGRRVLVLADDLRIYLESMPEQEKSSD